MKNNKSSFKTFFRIMSYVKRQGWLLLLSLICTAAVVGLTLYFPILIGEAVDEIVLGADIDFNRLADIFINMAMVVIANMIMQWIVSLLNNRVAYKTLSALRKASFEKLWNLPLSYVEKHKTGELLSIAMTDTEIISEGLLLGLSQFFQGVLMILGTISFMLFLNIKVTILVVFITPLSFFVAAYIARHTHDMFIKQSNARGKQTAFVEEIISNQKIVASFNKEKDIMNEFEVLNKDLKDTSLKATFYSSITNPMTRFVNSIVYAGVCVFGAFIVLEGKLSVGQLSAFLSYATQYTKPFNEISSVITELQNSLACAERLFSVLDESDETNTDTALNVCNGNIILENVSFSYDKNKPLIENLSVNVESGRRIAIVGPTGCGKTTLINLLMRFYDIDSGHILISDKDVSSVSRQSVRACFGMVLQETWLKNASIRENLLIAKTYATDEELMEAAVKSHSYSFIRHLPAKFDTIINEANLSEGQKQLLCITRLMLKMPPMLILDEATSSIDTRTEMQIQKAFAYMMNGRTSFIVAHRLSTIRNADWILVMKEGKVIEQGTHELLLNKKGFYYKLYNSQVALLE